jgi:hypothetical protein
MRIFLVGAMNARFDVGLGEFKVVIPRLRRCYDVVKLSIHASKTSSGMRTQLVFFGERRAEDTAVVISPNTPDFSLVPPTELFERFLKCSVIVNVADEALDKAVLVIGLNAANCVDDGRVTMADPRVRQCSNDFLAGQRDAGNVLVKNVVFVVAVVVVFVVVSVERAAEAAVVVGPKEVLLNDFQIGLIVCACFLSHRLHRWPVIFTSPIPPHVPDERLTELQQTGMSRPRERALSSM